MATKTNKKNVFCRIVEFTDCQVVLTRETETNNGIESHVIVITTVLDTSTIKEVFGYANNVVRDSAFLNSWTRKKIITWVLNQQADLNCKKHHANSN